MAMLTDNEKFTILNGPDDWETWLKELESRVHPILWDHMFLEDPGHDLMPCPVRPQYSDLSPSATKETDLSPAQQRIFEAAVRDYELQRKEFETQAKLIKQARDAITESVGSVKVNLLENTDTLRQWVKLLEQCTAPSQAYMMAKIRREYDEVIKGFRRTRLQAQWLDKWESVIQSGIKYKVPEMQGSQWLRDIALLIRSTNDSYASELIALAQKADDQEAASRQQGRMAITQLATIAAQINDLNALINQSNQPQDPSSIIVGGDESEATTKQVITQIIGQLAAQLSVSAVLTDADWSHHSLYKDVSSRLRELAMQCKPDFPVPAKRKRHPDEDPKELDLKDLFPPSHLKKRSEGGISEGRLSENNNHHESRQHNHNKADARHHENNKPDGRNHHRHESNGHSPHEGKTHGRHHKGVDCAACGMWGHDASRCWYVFDDLKPLGRAQNEWRAEKAKEYLRTDGHLRWMVESRRVKKEVDD